MYVIKMQQISESQNHEIKVQRNKSVLCYLVEELSTWIFLIHESAK